MHWYNPDKKEAAMKKGNASIRLALGLIAIGILCGLHGLAQSSDGPYYVVDPTIASPTDHVYNAIPAALAALNALGEGGWGATLVIYPGEYQIGATLNINIPGLNVVSRDGADKTQLVPAPAFAPAGSPLIRITAQDVRIADLKITGSGGVPASTGIQVDASDCELVNLLVDSHTVNGGIVSPGGADRLTVVGSRVLNNAANGISLTGCYAIRIENSEVRSNGAGIILSSCDNSSVVASMVVGNNWHGINVIGSRSVTISENSPIANNAGDGVRVQDSVDCNAYDNEIHDNTGAGIRAASSTRCTYSKNVLAQNIGGGIIIDNTGLKGASVANIVSENTVVGQEGPIGGAIPAVPGIQLAGDVRATRVADNTLSKNTWGINLVGVPPNAPPFAGGNILENNTIQDCSKDGIFVIDSAGNNVFRGNTIADSTKSGIAVLGSVGDDRFEDNTILNSGSAGFTMNASAPLATGIARATLSGNVIEQSGTHGIQIITANAPNIVVSTTIVGNVVTNCAGTGILVQSFPGGANTCSGLRIEENEVTGQEGDGIRIAESPGCVLRHNNVHHNHSLGLSVTAAVGGPIPNVTMERNFVWMNRQGGIALNASGTLVLVEENSIFENLGYGISMAGVPVAPPPPYPLGLPWGYSLARNWWGDPAGPSGAFAGGGNAVLGLTTGTKVLAPILPVPPAAEVGQDATLFLDLRGAQVVFIDSFAAKKVSVNRVDTAHLHLTFSGVSERDDGWVNTVPFTSEVIQSEPFLSAGSVMAASAVLLAGIQDGAVEVAFEYDPSQLPDGAKEEELALFVYQNGTWELSDEGVWTLQGGQWSAIKNCSILASNRVVGELPVTSLLGTINVIALVAPQPGGGSD